MTYFSPKFGNDPLTEALWMITMDGGHDEEAGTVDDIGWHGLIHIGGGAIEVKLDDMTVEVPDGTYIVYSDDQGFVGHETFDYRSAEASEAWRKIEDAYSEHLSHFCDWCESDLDENGKCSWKPEEHLQSA